MFQLLSSNMLACSARPNVQDLRLRASYDPLMYPLLCFVVGQARWRSIPQESRLDQAARVARPSHGWIGIWTRLAPYSLLNSAFDSS